MKAHARRHAPVARSLGSQLTTSLLFTLALFAAAVPATAFELATNGDFEDELADGWQVSHQGESSFCVRGRQLEEDADYEVVLYKGAGDGYARLSQRIALPSLEATFSIRAQLEASRTGAGPWAAAAVLLFYRDQLGNLLATTCIARHTAQCPWSNTPEMHLISVPDEAWHTYAFTLREALAYFTTLDLSRVAYLEVCIATEVGYNC